MAVSHYINSEILGYTEARVEEICIDMNEEFDKLLNSLDIYVHNNMKEIKKGDVITLIKEEGRYRNTGTFIYDGESVCDLCDIIDEYGSVPPILQVSDIEFSPYHWMNVIVHNNIFFLSNDLKNKLEDFKMEDNMWCSHIIINNVEYICIVDNPDEFMHSIKTMYFELKPTEFDTDKLNEIDGKYYKGEVPVFFVLEIQPSYGIEYKLD
jgi:hypothetical protein